MIVEIEVGFGRRFGVSLRLDADIDRLFSVASSGLFSGLEHGGHQILSLDSRRLPKPRHEVVI
jgi:hypothetical protein